MVVEGELNVELNKLRSSANSLSQCLTALLTRIEELEKVSGFCIQDEESANNNFSYSNYNIQDKATAKMLHRVAATLGNELNVAELPVNDTTAVNKREITTIDPIHGVKKQTIVTERIINSIKKVQALNDELIEDTHDESINFFSNGVTNLNDKTVIWAKRNQFSTFQPRIISISAKIIAQFEIDFFCGEAIVLKATPEAMGLVRPGDAILEISGQLALEKKQFLPPFANEKVTLKLVPCNTYALPMTFCKILDDYSANNHDIDAVDKNLLISLPSATKPDIEKLDSVSLTSETHYLPYLSFDLKKGDVLQIISLDKTYMQARKVDDLKAGFVPLNIKMERVAMLNPFGRRVLVLLGANGVGRRKLKSLLLQKMPNHFATPVPVTSRAPKLGEVNGHDFNFVTTEDFLNLIRQNQMVEWGELNKEFYGTSANSIRQVIRSGRVCVLDCNEKALKLIYKREFMPYVVVIAAPSFDELQYFNDLRAKAEGHPPVQPAETLKICEDSKRLLNSVYSKYFHLVLINRNFDVTLRRLVDALNHLKNESQWIPLDWLH